MRLSHTPRRGQERQEAPTRTDRCIGLDDIREAAVRDCTHGSGAGNGLYCDGLYSLCNL